MSGEELHQALEQGCINNCKTCKLFLKDNKSHCLLKMKDSWQKWANEESKRLEEKHNEIR